MAQVKRKSSPSVDSGEKKSRSITDFFTPVEPSRVSSNTVDEKVANELNKDDIPLKENKIECSENGPETSVQEPVEEKITTCADSNSNEIKKATKLQENTHTTGIEYTQFCSIHGFNKDQWVAGLSEEEIQLLKLEIDTLHITWLVFLHKELTKPYFLNLKRFLRDQKGKTVFPPAKDIYSWSHYTPLPDIKCLILGQDPYHNYNQAHGLAFSVLEPTKPPPSLVNIYKCLQINFPEFIVPDHKKLSKEGKPGGGNLTKWAKRGVLMLNACLTVEAHKANSHAGKGWEQFTEKVIETAILYARDVNKHGFAIMAWGLPAHKRVDKFSIHLKKTDVFFLVLRSVHPSPLSAYRGFFESKQFSECNTWLKTQGRDPINWGLFDGNDVC